MIKNIIILIGFKFIFLVSAFSVPLKTSIVVPANHYFLWLHASWQGGDNDIHTATFLPYIYFKNESASSSAFVSFSMTSFEKNEPMRIIYSLGEVKDGNWTEVKNLAHKGGRLTLSDKIPQMPDLNANFAGQLQFLNATVQSKNSNSINLIIVAKNIEDLKNFYTIPEGSIFNWNPTIVLK